MRQKAHVFTMRLPDDLFRRLQKVQARVKAIDREVFGGWGVSQAEVLREALHWGLAKIEAYHKSLDKKRPAPRRRA
jgi:predicted transcriptional regulator